MNNIIKKQIPKKYINSSATSFNNNIYILNNNEIDIYNYHLQKITSLKLNENYNSIYYNKYFYLTKKNIYNKIFIFNILLKEIDTIELKNIPNTLLSTITNININGCNIIITTTKGIYQTTKDGYYIKPTLIKNKPIKKIDTCCKQLIYNNYMCSAELCNKLLVAYNNQNSIYIYEISEPGSAINKTFIDDDINIINIFIYCNQIVLYASDKDKYSYIYFTNLCSNECKNNCKCSDINIINSIACEEYKLAKLIEAEANKINKVISNNPTNKEIIDVNKSVNETLTNITKLETLLIQKLQLLCKKKLNDDPFSKKKVKIHKDEKNVNLSLKPPYKYYYKN